MINNSSTTGPEFGNSSNDIPLNFVTPPQKAAHPSGQAIPALPAAVSAASPVEQATQAPPVDPPMACNVGVVTSDEATALSLSPAQKTAIIRLTSGATRADAATAAGVTRTTLYRWLNHDPAFQAAFNAWHKDLITTAQGQLLAASHEAIVCVLNAIRGGDSSLAWKLLQSQGLTKTGKPGSTDVALLQRQAELDIKRSEIAQRKEINKVLEDDMITMMPYESPL